MKVLLAAVLATASLLTAQLHTGGVTQRETRSEANRGVQSRIPHGTAISDPRMHSLPDCEDEGRTPCLTFDDVPGGWIIIKSYDPYKRSGIIKECGAEDGGPVLPCVWAKHKNRKGEWNYFTK
jgi:hypothetical protein